MRTIILSRYNLTLAILLAGIAGPLSIPQSLLAEPAPFGITDFVVADLQPAELAPESQEAVLAAYKESAQQMDWKIPEELEVASLQSYAIPEGIATQVLLVSYELEKDAVLFIMSDDPKVFQRMTQRDLENYDGKSAFFPAGKLVISVIHRKGTKVPKVKLERIRILSDHRVKVFPLTAPKSLGDIRRTVQPEALQDGELSEEVESLCRPDDRVRSTDKRVGRLVPIGCTGWLIQDNLGLSAGHCAVGTGMDIIEFQVPDSKPDGSKQPAHINDQYPVLRATMLKENGGVGNDWVVFEIGPNSNTGKLPGTVQGGHFKLSRNARPSKVRVSGFGLDSTPPGSLGDGNKDSQAQQTEDGNGAANAQYFPNAQNGSYFRYAVDTKGGNSGSPVIDSETGGGTAIAIHTHAGCETGGNHGTAVGNEDLRQAIKNFVGDLSKVYVDEDTESENAGSRPAATRFQAERGYLESLPSLEGELEAQEERAGYLYWNNRGTNWSGGIGLRVRATKISVYVRDVHWYYSSSFSSRTTSPSGQGGSGGSGWTYPQAHKFGIVLRQGSNYWNIESTDPNSPTVITGLTNTVGVKVTVNDTNGNYGDNWGAFDIYIREDD